MNVRLVRCICGRTYLAEPGERPCDPCNQADPRFDEHDSKGRLIRQRNARGQITYLAAASNTLELWGDTPRRATPDVYRSLDAVPIHLSPFGVVA